MTALGSHKPEHARYMGRRQIAALLWQCRAEPNAKAYLMFAAQYLLGLRVGEVIRLRYDHLGPIVRGWPEYVNVPTLKKKSDAWRGIKKDEHCLDPKGRPMPLLPVPVLSHPELIMAAFNAQYRDEKERKSRWLFPGRNPRKCLSRQQAIALFHEFQRKASLPDYFTPHVLRHSAATHLHEKCESVAVCTQFLRHSVGSGRGDNEGGSATTARYLHVTPERWRLYRGALDLPKLAPLARTL